MLKAALNIDFDNLPKQVSLKERTCRHCRAETRVITSLGTGSRVRSFWRSPNRLCPPSLWRFETAQDKVMSGRHAGFLLLLYAKRVTTDEAANDLASICMGLYGKPLPPQNGKPTGLPPSWKH